MNKAHCVCDAKVVVMGARMMHIGDTMMVHGEMGPRHGRMNKMREAIHADVIWMTIRQSKGERGGGGERGQGLGSAQWTCRSRRDVPAGVEVV